MKLLFDQNISFRIVTKLQNAVPNCTQVRLVGLENSSDKKIWEFAKNNGYTIVTFETDFYDISLIKGTPPKIVWLRFGNTSTNSLIKKLLENIGLIEEFITNEDYKEMACLEI